MRVVRKLGRGWRAAGSGAARTPRLHRIAAVHRPADPPGPQNHPMTPPCIHLVAGARPNFMKIAPIVRALQADGRLRWKLVHTGQHYDRNMSDVFFEELGIPAPDVHFNCGGGSHAPFLSSKPISVLLSVSGLTV